MSSIGRTAGIILIPALALALMFAGPAPFGAVSPAVAQQQERSGGGLLRFLFGGSETRTREAPAAAPTTQSRQQRRAVQPVQARQHRRTAQNRRQSAPAAPQTEAAVEKSEEANRVLVLGDFVASGLGEGLEAAYADDSSVVIVTRTNGSSGLVRDDYYDWPANIDDILEADDPAVVVIMIGANDRQELVVDGNREQPRSDAWMAEYERRAASMVEAVRAHEVHLIWVGMVPFRFRAMSSDMIAFNDLYRRLTEEAGGEYVDVWDGFVDEEGAFATHGPDMNGQPVQLRADDGINITRAGKRKLAFYVEKPLDRLLGEAAPQALTSIGQFLPLDLDVDVDEVDVTEIERTRPIALDDPALFGGGELLGGRPGNGDREAARRPGEDTSRGRPGRADDFTMRVPRRESEPEL